MKQTVRVLLVEDLQAKRDEVIGRLKAYCKTIDIAFKEAANYEDARALLKTDTFDIVILDLMIPAGDDDPSEKWSRKLLNDIVEGVLCYPMHVFGLTQHAELLPEAEQYYTRNMFGLFLFDWDNDAWAKGISDKIVYLARAVENGSSYRLNSYDFDVAILTARYDSEFVPVRDFLFGARGSDRHPLWPRENGAHFGRLKVGNDRFTRCGLICVGETGLAPAAVVSTQMIQTLRPRLLVMLGMCAGFASKGMRLLDIIVARETACWQEGKSTDIDETEKFDTRQKIRGWSGETGEKIERVLEVRAKELAAELQTQKETLAYEKLKQRHSANLSTNLSIRAGLLVSGSSVVASTKTQDEVIRRHPSALGLEMEAFSVYTAGHTAMGLKPEFLVIKGVADLADGNKADDAQALASELSARLFSSLLSTI
ncbi:hypothetical protein LB577_27440 [Mesorhizobium sp. B283B1A]|uniref:phosphorylase family protein n=1 Tax=Mesorhizobium TaxID=68287 RepID=UPI001CD05DA0|nr:MULTISPECIES: hypothetical protein [Mesorhizobium]MCA0050642.1 hypothetical protein [Mesorhizobium sp. B283B1A]UQS66926.1 hypothetical protein M5D98_11615 [Mesorhizobium opportunistum]